MCKSNFISYIVKRKTACGARYPVMALVKPESPESRSREALALAEATSCEARLHTRLGATRPTRIERIYECFPIHTSTAPPAVGPNRIYEPRADRGSCVIS